MEAKKTLDNSRSIILIKLLVDIATGTDETHSFLALSYLKEIVTQDWMIDLGHFGK